MVGLGFWRRRGAGGVESKMVQRITVTLRGRGTQAAVRRMDGRGRDGDDK